MTFPKKISEAALLLALFLAFPSCKKIQEFKQDPDLGPLQQGFKTSAAIGYCASLAAAAFEGQQLPENVVFEAGSSSEYSGSGLLYVNVDSQHPLPFNGHVGQIIIGGLWDKTTQGGVISIIFGDFDLLSADFKFYGLYTIPVMKKRDSDDFVTVFAEQDIVIGEGSDTLINLGLSRIQFDTELDRLDEEQPTDMFVAVKQNVWFVTVDQQQTFPDLYDDEYLINGGGQIVEATNIEGGIVYHALIETKFRYSDCALNPLKGTAFIQNIKAGDGVDLGNIVLDFHSDCDGQGRVQFATGEYLTSNGREVNLNFK